MRKYFLSLAILIIASLGFAQTGKNTVVIKGTLSGDLKGYNKIYLYTRMGIDSAVIENGQYTFTFPFTEVAIKMLYPEYIQKSHQMYQPFGILIAEPGTYYVTSDIAQGMYASSQVKGPESVVLYRQFEKEQGEAYKKLNTALASIYGQNWYRIDEKDSRYESFQHSRDSLNEVYLLPVIENLLRKHPDSYASAFVLSGSRQIGSIKQKEQLYKLLSARMKKSDPAQKFADYIQGLKSSGVGNTVANFVLPDPQGKPVDFKSFKGKYVLIDFWASWCAPCRKSFPHMREVYKTFKGEQFEIYSISIDENKAAWLKAVQEENNPWPQTLDTKNISQSGFAVTGVPSTFLIDPQGKIIAKEVGFDSNGGSEIEKKLVALFGKKVSTQTTPETNKEFQKDTAIPATKMSGN